MSPFPPAQSSSDIAQRLIDFVRSSFSGRLKAGETPTSSTPLFSSRLVDSMGLIELIAFIEREFHVILTDTMEELTALDTIGRLASEIERLKQTRQRS